MDCEALFIDNGLKTMGAGLYVWTVSNFFLNIVTFVLYSNCPDLILINEDDDSASDWETRSEEERSNQIRLRELQASYPDFESLQIDNVLIE